MIRNLSKLGVFLVLAALPWPASADQSVSQRAAMAADGALDVSNVAGEVSITGWDRNEVEVTGEIGHRQKLEFSADGERTRIEVHGSDNRHGDEEDADLVIRVPSGSRVRVSTVSAGITVRDVTNELQLQSVSGDIEAQSYAADVTIGTISGSIELAGHSDTGNIRLNLVSGDAWVRDVSGDLSVRTVSGDLNVRAGKLRRSRIDTTSGDVTLRARLDDDARFEVDSTSGDLRLELCGKPNAQFELSSFSGDIEAFGRKGESRNAHGPTSELRFKEGNGKGLVRIDTLSGEINLDDC
jgi:DUF4097 and DUF4098 domain-containing protein YvlB